MLKSILYRKDTGVTLIAKDTDWVWSDIEKGLQPTHTGLYFSVFELDVTAEQIDCADIENPTPCISRKTLKVNDIDNPTSLVEV